MVRNDVVVVRSMVPGTRLPSNVSCSRVSGHNIWRMDDSNERMRASTDGLWSKGPTLLFKRYGAVDHNAMSEGTRVYPRPPAGITYACGAPVYGSYQRIVPTDGRFLYDCDE